MLVAHDCNLSTQTEAEGSQVSGHPGLHSETYDKKSSSSKCVVGSVEGGISRVL
jgi:hypothetical protein